MIINFRRALLLISIMLSCQLLFSQQKPFDLLHILPDWQARWIGPQPRMYSESDRMLDEVHWIWSQPEVQNREIAPELDAEIGLSYFRRELEIVDPSQLQSATLWLTADNAFRLFVNGKFVLENESWEEADRVDILSYLLEGKNIIAIEAENRAYYHEPEHCKNPAGIIARLDLVHKNGKIQTMVTDENWKSTISLF